VHSHHAAQSCIVDWFKAPRIPILNTSLMWMVSFTPKPPLHPGKNPGPCCEESFRTQYLNHIDSAGTLIICFVFKVVKCGSWFLKTCGSKKQIPRGTKANWMLHSCCGSLVISLLLVESIGFTCEWYHVHVGISDRISFCGSIKFSFLMTWGDFETLPIQNSGSGVSQRDVIPSVIILETNLCHWASGSDEIYSSFWDSSYVGCIFYFCDFPWPLRNSTRILTYKYDTIPLSNIPSNSSS
jgi:hypothetical protein